MIGKRRNVEVFRNSRLGVEDILEFGAEHVAFATGSRWRRDGVGAFADEPAEVTDGPTVLTPDDVFAGAEIGDRVVIYDDEHYVMGGALAERFLKEGRQVTLVTPETMASAWTAMTDEQGFVQARLLESGLEFVPTRRIASAADGILSLACIYTGRPSEIPFDTLVLVTGRLPERGVFDDVTRDPGRLQAAGVQSVERIGDCRAPSSSADAVYSGHRYARALEEPPANTTPRRERPALVVENRP